jgi:hypothetical protein
MRKFVMGLVVALAVSSSASASEVALLLFDGKTGSEFAGCLNCSRHDEAAVCNRYGEYGSRYSDLSIWSRYGQFGSRDVSPKFPPVLRRVLRLIDVHSVFRPTGWGFSGARHRC